MSKPKYVKDLFQEAIQHFKQGNYRDAEDICLMVLNEKPHLTQFQDLLKKSQERICQLTYNEHQHTFSAVVIFNVSPNQAIPIYFDTTPQFNLGIFDYSGKNYIPKLPYPISFYYSEKTEGKGHIMQIASEKLPENFSYYGFIDHDVFIKISDINKMLFIANTFNIDLFQPSLSLDSYSVFPHLYNKPGYIIKETSLVEPMVIFFSNYAYLNNRKYFYESLSGWGIEFIICQKLFEEKRKMAIIHEVIAGHKKPLSSNHWLLSNGLTSPQELDKIKQKYNLYGWKIF